MVTCRHRARLYASCKASLLSRMQSVDIDAVIIGGWWGKGKRGGLLAQYLLALLEQPHTPGRAPVFLSFCKCAAPEHLRWECVRANDYATSNAQP